ncbi:MAG: YchJ family protein [Thiobacillaceae bacterium]
MAKEKLTLICACGSGLSYQSCCGRYHHGEPVCDAESLMRSRYTAYAMCLESYLLETWHPTTRPASLDLVRTPQPQWIGLNVTSHRQLDADHATVEFVARYKINGRASRIQEASQFVRQAGRWFYIGDARH